MNPRLSGPKNCIQCGVEIGYWRQKFCTNECARIYAKARQRREYRERHALWVPNIVSCQICGVEFTERGPGQNYCSRLCRTRANYQRIRQKRPLKPILNCERCGKSFEQITRQSKFCSPRCRRSHSRRNRRKSLRFIQRQKQRNKLRYQSDPAYRKRCLDNAKRAYKLNPLLRIRSNLRHRMKRLLKGQTGFSALVGCTTEVLRSWIEAKWTPTMTWDNYGKFWVVDHRIPLAAFDLSDEKQRRIACHYTNLQPMTRRRNLQKSDKIVDGQIALMM